MKFSMMLLFFAVVALLLSMAYGPAAILVSGVVFVLVLTVLGEVNRTKTKKGREQMDRERREEEEYVNEWGSTQYWDDLEDDGK